VIKLINKAMDEVRREEQKEVVELIKTQYMSIQEMKAA
jgi:hypothetical protein